MKKIIYVNTGGNLIELNEDDNLYSFILGGSIFIDGGKTYNDDYDIVANSGYADTTEFVSLLDGGDSQSVYDVE